METKPNQKEAEAFGNQPLDPAYVISVPYNVPLIVPPVYYDASEQRWSWRNLVTSVIGFFFCPLCGVVATVMAMASYTDHKAKDFARSQKKRKWAYGLAIPAIVIGFILLMVYFI